MKRHKIDEILLMLAFNTNQSLDIYKQNVNHLCDFLQIHICHGQIMILWGPSDLRALGCSL